VTPAEVLAAAADKLDGPDSGSCPCERCKRDEALAEVFRSEAQAFRGGERRGFDGADLYRVNPRMLVLARLIIGGES
jgi:hypothetical protein